MYTKILQRDVKQITTLQCTIFKLQPSPSFWWPSCRTLHLASHPPGNGCSGFLLIKIVKIWWNILKRWCREDAIISFRCPSSVDAIIIDFHLSSWGEASAFSIRLKNFCAVSGSFMYSLPWTTGDIKTTELFEQQDSESSTETALAWSVHGSLHWIPDWHRKPVKSSQDSRQANQE